MPIKKEKVLKFSFNNCDIKYFDFNHLDTINQGTLLIEIGFSVISYAIIFSKDDKRIYFSTAGNDDLSRLLTVSVSYSKKGFKRLLKLIEHIINNTLTQDEYAGFNISVFDKDIDDLHTEKV